MSKTLSVNGGQKSIFSFFKKANSIVDADNTKAKGEIVESKQVTKKVLIL